MDKEDLDLDDFEEDKLEVAKVGKKGGKGVILSVESSQASEGSASATLLSSHAMRMGLYTINLGTKTGQRLHTGHMLFLPLIPVFILLGQNIAAYLTCFANSDEIMSVQTQVPLAQELFFNHYFYIKLHSAFYTGEQNPCYCFSGTQIR